MKILKTAHDVRLWRQTLCHRPSPQDQDKSLGFVPTMGGLHEGHLSLVRRSLLENTWTLVSVFLNPTQFDRPTDLENYPHNLSLDLKTLKDMQIDAIFTPSYQELYPDHYRYKVIENEISQTLCGAFRKGHFEGVLTVVLKLLNIVQANKAYFGEKDFQQLELVKGLVKAFFLNVEIVGCPTVRENSSLAWSSRNQHLSKEGRKQAGEFFKILRSSLTKEKMIQHLTAKNFKVEYIQEKAGRRYGSVFYEGVRLIDNVKI